MAKVSVAPPVSLAVGLNEYAEPAFTEVDGAPEIRGVDVDDGLVVPVSPEGDVPDPLEVCDGAGALALDPEPPQPASAATASATVSARKGEKGER